MNNTTTTSELLEGFGDLVPFSEYPNADWPEGPRSGIQPITSISDREAPQPGNL